VITLNSIATSLAATDFLFMLTGLLGTTDLAQRVYYPQARELRDRPALAKAGCRFCDANVPTSAFARGDLRAMGLKPGARPQPVAARQPPEVLRSLPRTARKWHQRLVR
jgi:hypothetical protein